MSLTARLAHCLRSLWKPKKSWIPKILSNFLIAPARLSVLCPYSSDIIYMLLLNFSLNFLVNYQFESSQCSRQTEKHQLNRKSRPRPSERLLQLCKILILENMQISSKNFSQRLKVCNSFHANMSLAMELFKFNFHFASSSSTTRWTRCFRNSSISFFEEN